MDVVVAVIGVFIGELYGSLVGGGSLVTQIALQNILDMDIKEAIALDNAAVLGSLLGLFITMIRKHQVKKWFWVYAAFQSCGAFVGSQILVRIDSQLLKVLFIVALVLLVAHGFFSKQPDNEADRSFDESYKNIALLCLFGVFIGAYNAAFVLGDWIIALLIFTSVFSMKYQRAIFLLVFTTSLSIPVASYQYYSNDLLDFSFLIPMTMATFVSGAIAGVLLSRIRSQVLESILKYLGVVLMAYLAWGIMN